MYRTRFKIAAPSLVAIAVAACSLTHPQAVFSQPPRKIEVQRTSFEGTIKFDGEFALFPIDKGKNVNGVKCISGYFFPPPRHVEIGQRFNNTSVVVTGKLVKYSDVPQGDTLSTAHLFLKNTCGGQYVLMGESVKRR